MSFFFLTLWTYQARCDEQNSCVDAEEKFKEIQPLIEIQKSNQKALKSRAPLIVGPVSLIWYYNSLLRYKPETPEGKKWRCFAKFTSVGVGAGSVLALTEMGARHLEFAKADEGIQAKLTELYRLLNECDPEKKSSLRKEIQSFFEKQTQ